MKIVTKNTIKKECWNLDYNLTKWINEHLKIYRDDSKSIVNLEYHKFNYNNKEYTQLQILNRLIDITDYLISDEVDYFIYDEKLETYKNEMYDLLKLIHWCLWW